MNRIEIHNEDALDGLQRLPADSVHAICFSPPYWGAVRDYGTGGRVWPGRDPACEHDFAPVWVGNANTGGGVTRKQRTNQGSFSHAASHGGPVAQKVAGPRGRHHPICRKCSAWRGELGHEPTPELYTRNLRLIVDECYRVLHPTGCMWINLGDNFAGSGRGRNADGTHQEGGKQGTNRGTIEGRLFANAVPPGLKAKDTSGIPWRVAFALQGFSVVPSAELFDYGARLRGAIEAGDWDLVCEVQAGLERHAHVGRIIDPMWLRCDVIWDKPNAFPFSGTDRPTRSHEYLFLLTKRSTYFYDHVAILEPLAETSVGRGQRFEKAHARMGKPGRNGSKQALIVAQGLDGRYAFSGLASGRTTHPYKLSGKNKRSVWTVPAGNHKGQHMATYPKELMEPAILASTSAHGCCPKCKAPWERVTRESGPLSNGDECLKEIITLGFRPTCTHFDQLYQTIYPQARSKRKRWQRAVSMNWWRRVRLRPGSPDWEVEPCVVLDPFLGSGTTLAVAKEHGRAGIGFEINPAYFAEAEKTLAGPRVKRAVLEETALPLAPVTPQETLF